MTTRYTDGSTTVGLDDGLTRFVRNLLSAAETATVARMEAEFGEVAEAARRAWYGEDGVEKETGLSGAIETVTTFDAGRGTVTVSVGSTDSRRAGKKNKPVVVFVHRPGRDSMVWRTVSPAEFWRTPALTPTNGLSPHRGNFNPTKADVKAKRTCPYIWVPNPARGDGSFLLQTLVKKPAKAKIRTLTKELGREIVRQAEANRGR